MQFSEAIKALRRAFDVSRGRARYATIRDRVVSSARVDGIHLCQLIAAMLIASIGLNTNSTEAVIGAMLICPLMGSVVAMAYGIAIMDRQLVRNALAGLTLQCGICLVTSTLYFLISPLSIKTSSLITYSTATIWDVLTALVGGFAGALGISRRQEPYTLLSGVAVATALMPPLCTTGYGVSMGSLALALSALYEFAVNLLFIAFGSMLVFIWLHAPLKEDADGDGKVSKQEHAAIEHSSHLLRRRIAVALAIFAIPCCYFSFKTVQSALENNGGITAVYDLYDTRLVTKELAAICPGFVSYRVGDEERYDAAADDVSQRTVATITTKDELSAAHKLELEALVRVHVTDVDEVVFEVEAGRQLEDVSQSGDAED